MKEQHRRPLHEGARRPSADGSQGFSEDQEASAPGTTKSRPFLGGTSVLASCVYVAHLDTEKGCDLRERSAVTRTEHTIVANLDEPVGQYMWQKASNALLSGEGTELGFTRSRFLVLEGNLPLFYSQDTVIADGDPEDVRREIWQRFESAADGFTGHDPVLFPYLRWQVGEQLGFL